MCYVLHLQCKPNRLRNEGLCSIHQQTFSLSTLLAKFVHALCLHLQLKPNRLGNEVCSVNKHFWVAISKANKVWVCVLFRKLRSFLIMVVCLKYYVLILVWVCFFLFWKFIICYYGLLFIILCTQFLNYRITF
jgi:hypothetical protein